MAGDGRAIWLIGVDVVNIGGNHQLKPGIAAEIGSSRVGVVHSPAVTGWVVIVLGKLGPAGAGISARIEHPGVAGAAVGAGDHNLQRAVIAIQVGHKESAELASSAGGLFLPFQAAVWPVGGDGTAALRDNDFRLAVFVKISDHHAGPGPVVGAASAPDQLAGLAVQSPKRIGRGNDLFFPSLFRSSTAGDEYQPVSHHEL